MAKKTITNEIVKWLESMGWEERPEPLSEGSGTMTSFGYSAGGEYGLDCMLTAAEDIGIISLTGSSRFTIPEERVPLVEEYCSRIGKDHGNLAVFFGKRLGYIHSRSIESFANGIDDVAIEIQKILDDMDEYVALHAPAIISIINGEGDTQKNKKKSSSAPSKSSSKAKREVLDSFIPSAEAEEMNGAYFSHVLKGLGINSIISKEDKNLLFIDYEGLIGEDLGIDPSLSIYFDQESKFARFTLINTAPEVITKKTIGPLIESLNKNYVLTSYEYTESDGNFYITSEYWLNYKFGLDPAVIKHLIVMMPSILIGALSAEL